MGGTILLYCLCTHNVIKEKQKVWVINLFCNTLALSLQEGVFSALTKIHDEILNAIIKLTQTKLDFTIILILFPLNSSYCLAKVYAPPQQSTGRNRGE